MSTSADRGSRRGATVAALLGLAAPAVAAPPPPSAPDVRGIETAAYVVRPGDTLLGIASRYLNRADAFRAVQTLNHIGNATRLPVGGTLRIPLPLLKAIPSRARIVSFRGAVRVSGGAARIGGLLGEGARIETGPNASIGLVLEDRSTVTLPSQSAIRIERLRTVALLGTQRLFRLEQGRSQYQVTPSTHPGDRFEIRTPVSVAAVRGTEFRVAVGGDDRSATSEVLKGTVGVAGNGGAIALPAGFGARSDATSVGTPVALLPPPEVTGPIYHRRDGSLTFTLTTVAGAVRYRLQIAADAAFQDIRDEALADTPAVIFATAPVGAYFIRLTAIDANGLEGIPRVHPFEYRPGAHPEQPPPGAPAAVAPALPLRAEPR